jgi:hypothetical protein
MPIPDSSRLNDLRRQRALMQEHLAWLDREIAEETGMPSGEPPAITDIPNIPSTESAASASAAEPVSAEAEKVLDEFRVPPGDIQENVRRGCLIYFFVGLVLFAAAVVGLYFVFRHSRGE